MNTWSTSRCNFHGCWECDTAILKYPSECLGSDPPAESLPNHPKRVAKSGPVTCESNTKSVCPRLIYCWTSEQQTNFVNLYQQRFIYLLLHLYNERQNNDWIAAKPLPLFQIHATTMLINCIWCVLHWCKYV